MIDMTSPHPSHVKAMRLSAILFVAPFAVAASILEFTRLLPPGAFAVPVLLAAAYLVLRVPARRYRALGYSLSEERLRTVRGVLFRSDTVVPFGRVQHIDVHQGPIERAYGLGTLILHTAGNHNASVRLPGLGHGDALAMREQIRAHVKRETM